MVDAELKIEVKEDMRAASITASIKPLNPSGIFSFTSLMKAMLEHPPLFDTCYFFSAFRFLALLCPANFLT